MADPLARLLLAGGTLGDGTPASEMVRRYDLLIVEGVPDFLTWATRYGDAAERAPGVIGIISGSWLLREKSRGQDYYIVPDPYVVLAGLHKDKKLPDDRVEELDELAEALKRPTLAGSAADAEAQPGKA